MVLPALLAAACGQRGPAATPEATPDLAYYSKYAVSAAEPISGLGTVYSVDWMGRPHATIRIPQTAGAGAKFGPPARTIRRVSQDGARLLLSDGTILDPSGRSLAQIDPRAAFGWRWAEDDAHLCEVTVPSYESFTGGVLEGPVSLLWAGLDGPPRTVALVGSANGQDSVEVAACNSTADRAVVVQSTLVSVPNRNTMSAISAARELMVVQLSTGRFLYRHTYPIGQDPLSGTMLTVSTDGTRVAESLHYAALELKLSRDPASPTIIRELPGGQEVGMTDAGAVVTFSGDDSLVLTSTRLPYDAARQRVPFLERLIDWKTGDVAWERSRVFQFVLANPRGRAFLVVEDESLRLIFGDGSSQEVATGVDELWSNFGA